MLSEKLSIRALYNPTVLLAMALMAVIAMMILPIPSWMLDLGLAASFALAILIFTITLFIERPLDFSAFPTVLLASLMLRLSLNVSSTKLIIGQGHTGPNAAGEVIKGFASFIMGGNIFLGLVVFTVLLIVNFVVITKGAGRMAEVGARFALDGMPGKQLAIDSDMAAGAIGHEEASERRRIEQEETTFFGSLDGVSKFVKGDAIAGLMITMLNLFMGLGMGIGVHGMSFSDAIATYSMLTVGDGLVSQIPSVVISVASALLLSKGGVLGSADRALTAQLGAHPAALGVVSALLAMFAFVPGLPFIPFIIGSIGLGAAALHVRAKHQRAAKGAEALPAKPVPQEKSLGDLLDVDEIHVEFAPDLVSAVMDEATGLDVRIANMRKHIALEYGFIIPQIRLTDNAALPSGEYRILIQGIEAARNRLRPGMAMVLLDEAKPFEIRGEDVKEPVYGAPARWIARDRQEEAAMLGLPIIAPTEVVATHLLESIQGNFGRLLTRRAVQKILDEFVAVSDPKRADQNRRLLNDYVPDKIPVELLQSVMRLLLEERVSIRNLPMLLEAAADGRTVLTTPEQIAEYVRQRLGFQLVSKLISAEGTLPLIQLAPEWEALFLEHQCDDERGAPDIALPPSEFSRLAGSVNAKLGEAAANGHFPAIVTSSRRRRFVHTVLEAKGVRNPVIAFEEIGAGVRPALVGMA